MILSELGEDASLQAAEGKAEGGELFDLNSLPPGYRFNPTDAEIIVFYLGKKIDHQPLPPNKIIEVNLYAYDPDELAARYEPSGNGEWFYFTPRDRKYQNGRRPNRSVRDGYWKATGADKEIKFEDRTVGYRKALVFYRGSAQNGVKTNWMMHEFTVAKPSGPPRRSGVNDMRDLQRSRYESQLDESSSSSSKIPRLELNPNPIEANNPYEEQYYYNNSQMPLEIQQSQPRTEIFQTPQEHDHFALQSNTQFPILDPSVLAPLLTHHQSTHCIGNEFGGQGLDNFDIMNGAFGNSSFDAGTNIDFGNVPDLDATIDFGNLPGFDSTDYGNQGLYPMIDYGNDIAAPMSSNMSGNYGRQL
ncbi:hypothetical protein AAG906_031997 [Vitis piasezkii]